MANLGAQAGSGFDASDLTTGTLGNTVQDNITRLGNVTTGTMNNTIGSSATFPAHHIIQIDQNNFTSQPTRTSTSLGAFSSTVGHTISNCKSNSKIFIQVSLAVGNDGSSGARHFGFRLVDVTNSNATIGSEGAWALFGDYLEGEGGNAQYGHLTVNFSILYTPPSFNSGSFEVNVHGKSSNGTMYINRRHWPGTTAQVSSNIILMEVAG
jgi:hypothetical protein